VDIPLGAEIDIGSGPSLPPIISGGQSRTGKLGSAPGSGTNTAGRGLAQANFLMADELVAIARVQPAYPDQLRFRRIEGEVLVEFLVTATGEVRDARVIKGSPRGSFDRAALAAISRWRFQPRRGESGKPVPVRVRQHFKFTLR
jgi:periplasmic protein TonB